VTAGPGTGREAAREHDDLHLLLGAFVLGGLDPEEHQAFTRHLRHCPACQQESAQLSGLPALLDLVDATQVEAAVAELGMPDAAPPPAPAVLVPPALLERMRADRRRRRWRIGVAAAVLAILAGGVGAAVGPLLGRLSAPPSRPLVATAAPTPGAAPQVEIDLVTRAWGTQLDLRGTSLPPGQVLYLSVTDREGHAYDVASWTGTPSGRATLTAACWMPTANIAQVQVHMRDGGAVATATT
jgi:hypothetical protein